jgi:flagellar basal-body rod protein FlgB
MIKKTLFFCAFCILTMSCNVYGANHIAMKKSDNSDNGKNTTTNELMKSYLELTAFKHKILSENLANVNTPGYKAEDVDSPKDYSDLTGKGRSNRALKLVITSDNHIADTKRSSGKLSSHKLKDPYEVKPNGNNVSLAQQMTKLSQNQQDYNAAVKGYAVMNSLVSAVLGK